MREHAVERHAADWVLPLDVDEFLAVSAGATLVSGSTNVDAPLALAWQTYVPDDCDIRLQLNPVLAHGLPPGGRLQGGPMSWCHESWRRCRTLSCCGGTMN